VTETPRRATADNKPRPPAGARQPGRDVVAGDAELAPDSEDEAEPEAEDDPIVSGIPWNDPHFATPSSIKLEKKVFSAVEWLRPQVGPVCILLGTGSFIRQCDNNYNLK